VIRPSHRMQNAAVAQRRSWMPLWKGLSPSEYQNRCYNTACIIAKIKQWCGMLRLKMSFSAHLQTASLPRPTTALHPHRGAAMKCLFAVRLALRSLAWVMLPRGGFSCLSLSDSQHLAERSRVRFRLRDPHCCMRLSLQLLSFSMLCSFCLTSSSRILSPPR
jgi:hypothetical protein